MTSLPTPWTPDRQIRAVHALATVDADCCSPERLLAWNDVEQPDVDGACVVYWMARSQRGVHNLALDCAIAAARALTVPLVVVFRLTAGPDGTNLRHVDWMLRGLPDAFADCATRGAHVLLLERGGIELHELFARQCLHPALVVTDDDVMHPARRSRTRVADELTVPFVSVDADVVVPGACFPRQEYAARTLRPKLHRILHAYDGERGDDTRGRRAPELPLPIDLARIEGVVAFDPSRTSASIPGADLRQRLASARHAGTPDAASLLPDAPSGTRAAMARLRAFVDGELDGYALRRNQPHVDGTSQLSRFSHFGQVSPHVVLDAVRTSGAPSDDVAAFVEEFVVRRELAANYVRWNPAASSLDGAPDWAKRTLAKHAADPRLALYDDAVLDAGDTIDPLWNAAQRQLVETGHMHGYLRMYWAKQVLTWRDDPADAFDTVLRMNDRWHLDGRDPNGIVGVAWAIAGVHDRPWTERAIYGQIRCMTLASTGRKFDSRAYVARWGGVRGAAASHPGRFAPTTRSQPLF